MSLANIFDLPASLQQAPIKEGDAVLIIKPGGEVVPMTFGVDQKKAEALKGKDPSEMSEEEVNIALQGQSLFLLSMAANNDAIMQFLAKLASTPGETDFAKMKSVASMH